MPSNNFELPQKSLGLNKTQLEAAKESSLQLRLSLSAYLLSKELIDENQQLESLKTCHKIPYIKLSKDDIDLNVARLIPESIARTHSVLPIFLLEDVLYVAISSLESLKPLQDIEHYCGVTISPVLSNQRNILSLINYSYSYERYVATKTNFIKNKFVDLGLSLEPKSKVFKSEIDAVQDSLFSLIQQAVDQKVSDIHIDSDKENVIISFDYSGQLNPVMKMKKNLGLKLIEKVKALTNKQSNNPDEKALTISVNNRDYYISLSSVQTLDGEKLVVKISPNMPTSARFTELSLTKEMINSIKELMTNASGLIICCNPNEESDQSSVDTLLSQLNTAEKDIISVEQNKNRDIDSIQYIDIENFTQSNKIDTVNSVINQNPDILLLDDVCELDNSDAVLRASQHKLLTISSMTESSSLNCISKLSITTAQHTLLSSALLAIFQQKKLRALCPNCKIQQVIEPINKENETLIKEFQKHYPSTATYTSTGCNFCDNSGFKGYTYINELIIVDDTLKESLIKQLSLTQLNSANSILLKDDAFTKLAEGLCSIADIQSILN